MSKITEALKVAAVIGAQIMTATGNDMNIEVNSVKEKGTTKPGMPMPR